MTAAASTDGRVLRGERNREAIVDALLALYRAGELQPTTQRVAEMANVAPRSVYHHFADMEDLIGEVSRRQLREHGHLMDAPMIAGPLDERVSALVARRGELFEAVAPVRRAAVLQAHRSRTLRDNLGALARRLRQQVETLFAAELAARSTRARAELVDALDLLTSWEAWDRLRSQQGLGARRARGVLVASITTLLEDTR
jgi:TetR/AcrR family transcriptional regulator, regulator of autoinduction and epiphytic fitness